MPANRPAPGHAALRSGRTSLALQVYLVTISTINRTKFFDQFSAACIAALCFENRALLGDASMLAWVLMPDHSHWLLQLGGHDELAIVVNRLKSASARLVNRTPGRNGPLWSPAYHDHALRTEEDLPTVARYVVANPVRAGLVKRVGDYPFWNAVWI